MVDFLGTYHALLGRPCYKKFMIVPHNDCMKLKMPEPQGGITVDSPTPEAYLCEHEGAARTTTVVVAADDFAQKSSAS
jgi:hypothetical protein